MASPSNRREFDLEPPPPPATSPHIEPSQARKNLILSLRYAISPKEYAALRKKLKARAPPAISKTIPSRREFEMVIREQAWNTNTDRRDFDFLPSASRTGLRVFVGGKVLFEVWDLVKQLLARRKGLVVTRQSYPRFRSPNTRAAFSLSVLLVLHRLLFRFFSTLRRNLLLPSAKTFRRRHPRAAKLLTSKLSPAVGAGLAGLALAIHPSGDARTGIAVYALVKSFEYTFNLAEIEGIIQNRPWWFGSWLLFPITSAQLLHAFVFDRDCFPTEYGNFIMGYSNEYIQKRPETYPSNLSWPGAYEIVDGIANVARHNYPPFVSPILNPLSTAPASLKNLSPVFSPAHPLTSSLQCAILHPNEPSCSKTYLSFIINEFPRIAKFFTIFYTIIALPSYKRFLTKPITFLNKLGKSAIFSSLSVTGAIGTSWTSLCLFQKILPRMVLPMGRFYLAGLIGGMWSYVDYRPGKRSNLLNSLRLGIISAWKVGVKRGYWRNVKNGDVYLFVLALAVANSVTESQSGEEAVTDGWVRKGLGMLRGESSPRAGEQEDMNTNNMSSAVATASEEKGKEVQKAR